MQAHPASTTRKESGLAKPFGVAFADRASAEEKLRKSEEKYRDLIEISPDAIYVVDANGICVLGNRAGAELAGIPQDELVGTLVTETYLPEEHYLFRERIGGGVRDDRLLCMIGGRSAGTHVWSDDEAIDCLSVSFWNARSCTVPEPLATRIQQQDRTQASAAQFLD